MRILITGICGFVGSTLAKALQAQSSDYQIIGIDNLSRSGSWLNKAPLQQLGIKVFIGDIRQSSDVDSLPPVDWVIDAAANPSVLAGVDGQTSSLQLVQHNLLGTINLLEYCKRYQAGFVLLSTSRVYSIPQLSQLQMSEANGAFQPTTNQEFPIGISTLGVSENYSTAPPVSLYGSTKVASEHLALEYGTTFGFPVWINRCGVMAGAGQFGHPMQGIFAFWLHSFREKRPLKYIGFGGKGYQVRDCLHPRDLICLLTKQFLEPLDSDKPRIINISGGIENSMSLYQLTRWCQEHIGDNDVISTDSDRPFDIPWIVLNPTLSSQTWDWQPQVSITKVLEEITEFANQNQDWLTLSSL